MGWRLTMAPPLLLPLLLLLPLPLLLLPLPFGLGSDAELSDSRTERRPSC